jgi:nucleoside-diphosphate-sugar epimerase
MNILLTGGSGFIGTNFVETLLERGDNPVNLSDSPPFCEDHRAYWKKCDILDHESLLDSFRIAEPEAVVHLAARTDCDESVTVEQGYRVNTDGTANVLEAIRSTPSIRRAIIVSSQFVCGPGYQPKHDTDFLPATVYGQSKAISEKLTREASLKCCWTIVRPTNIWGPWHMRYKLEFWRAVRKGYYVHPAGPPVVRCYGYVGNIVDQMLKILEVPEKSVNSRVVYLGDPPADIRLWVNAFSRALRGRDAIEVPRWLLCAAGQIGGIVEMATRKPFYINPSRARSMMTDYVVSMDATYDLLGKPKYTLEQGVARTVEWLQREIRQGIYEA